MSRGFHESLERSQETKGGSDRAFGLVFAAVFAIVGAWPLLDSAPPRAWALALAAAFLALAALRPAWLAPLNRAWTRLGLLLHRLASPLVLGLTFLFTVLPVGLAMRLAGRDPLCRRFEPEADSYWIAREPAGPTPESMKDQF